MTQSFDIWLASFQASCNAIPSVFFTSGANAKRLLLICLSILKLICHQQLRVFFHLVLTFLAVSFSSLSKSNYYGHRVELRLLLLVCTYKCVHLNISRFEENQAGWYRTKLFGIPYWPEEPLLRKTLRKFRWMFFILMAPELGVPIALDKYLKAEWAVTSAKLHPKEGKSIDERLTLTRGFYANIGGFAGVLAASIASFWNRGNFAWSICW